MQGLDVREVVTRMLKYFVEGLVVAVAAYVMPGKVMKVVGVLGILIQIILMINIMLRINLIH